MMPRPTHILAIGFLLAAAPTAVSAALPVKDGFSSREILMLIALAVSGAVLIAALGALLLLRFRIRKHVRLRRDELRHAFAEAYVGLKNDAADAKKVREAAQAIEKIITDMEHLI